MQFRRSDYRLRARAAFSALLACLIAPCTFAELRLAAYEKAGIYDAGEKVGWCMTLPTGFAVAAAPYLYVRCSAKPRQIGSSLPETAEQDMSSPRIGEHILNGSETRSRVTRRSAVAPNSGDATAREAVTARPAVKSSPRSDANSQLAHRELLKKAKRGRIDVYFVGDSITRRWGTSDPQYEQFLKNWNENFFGWSAANFGWGADTVQNILWRLENGELAGVGPKVIVIQAGTNNVGTKSDNRPVVDEVTRGIRAIIDECQKQAPDVTIVLMAIFPRNDNVAFMPIIDAINTRIGQFADGKKVRFLNVNDKLADKEGLLHRGMADEHDKLHLDVRGYQVWADGLKPIFHELLGPPATIDCAPPPTGDPSVKRLPN
jgi:lysophospholipase L1-like esterase